MCSESICMKASRHDVLVIDKGVHEQPLLYEAFPLRLFPLQVSVGIIGHDDAVHIICQLDDESVIIAHHPLSCHAP